MRPVGSVGSFRSCRAIQEGFLVWVVLSSDLVSHTWSLLGLSRSTGTGSYSNSSYAPCGDELQTVKCNVAFDC